MNLELSAEDLAFREEVRDFLRDHLPPHLVDAARRTTTVFVDRAVALEWQGILAARGWAAPSWPVEWGGTDWTPTQRYLFALECFRAGAPRLIPLGLGMLAPVLLAFGTEAQKRHYLPKILSGEHYWCQGYSEPGSGSDLASLQLKAERRTDHYLLNGSKLWTTHAHFADHIFCLVRTDATGKPQQGISFLLVPLDLPGIEIRPIITMGMSHEVNQVFFQDVQVPLANLVGEEGKGWTCAKYLLEFERGGGSTAALRQHELDAVKHLLADMRAADSELDADRQLRKAVARIAHGATSGGPRVGRASGALHRCLGALHRQRAIGRHSEWGADHRAVLDRERRDWTTGRAALGRRAAAAAGSRSGQPCAARPYRGMRARRAACSVECRRAARGWPVSGRYSFSGRSRRCARRACALCRVHRTTARRPRCCPPSRDR